MLEHATCFDNLPKMVVTVIIPQGVITGVKVCCALRMVRTIGEGTIPELN